MLTITIMDPLHMLMTCYFFLHPEMDFKKCLQYVKNILMNIALQLVQILMLRSQKQSAYTSVMKGAILCLNLS